MRNYLLVLMMLFAVSSIAQSTHTINFEPGGTGSDWTWVVAENADNPPLEFVANPDNAGINTSATAAKFIARTTGNPWALCFTDGDGVFTFDATNAIVKIMVYKQTISNIGFKFEGMSGAFELLVPNTLINQWEEVTFDFSSKIGSNYKRIVIIPDFTFGGRPTDNVLYFDNIQVPDGFTEPPLAEPTTVPPVPAHATENVLSVYTEVYTNIPGTNFNPNWGQSTAVTVDFIAAGNKTLKYANLNYQGTQYPNQNVSGYQYLHVDFWTPNATNLSFYLISPDNETNYPLPITLESWVSVDIPLSHYVPPVNLADVFQFKVTGNGTVYFDNLYFWKNPGSAGTDATLSDLKVDGTTVPGFLPGKLNYYVELPFGTTIVPVVSATTTDPNAGFVVNDAAFLPGNTEVVVTAADGITMQTYTVLFSLAIPPPIYYDVTFQVDMSQYNGTFNEVDINGSFNGWCGNCNPLADANADKVYEVTLNLLSGSTFEYIFTVDTWGNQEVFAVGEPCTSTLGVFTNRTLYVDQTMILPVVCWNLCDACPTYQKGWSGISSNLIPEDKMSIEELFAPVLDDMVIMLGTNGIFWHDQNINTLGAWDTYQGYKVKFDKGVIFEFTGSEPTDRTVPVDPGIVYMPVLSQGPASVEDVIMPLGDSIVFIFDITTNEIYWPEGGLVPGVTGALETIVPGFAYLTKVARHVVIDFGSKSLKSGSSIRPSYKDIEISGLNEVMPTGTQHIISLATSTLISGDVVGVFNADGLCAAKAAFNSSDKVVPLIVFGDDVTTDAKDGIISGEELYFRIYRNGQELEATAIYNNSAPNSDGLFAENGLSIIRELKLGATGISNQENAIFSIFPNPGNGQIFINLVKKTSIIFLFQARMDNRFSRQQSADHRILI